jgi:type I restriction enzyme R subunit
VRWEQLDEDLDYPPEQLDRSVVSPDQIRTVIKTFRDKLFTEIFPGRTEVPKTLIFAKDDSHAEDIVHIVREEFSKGNEFCKKITYKTTGEKPEDLIASFRNSYNPRIAVTVDMIATGTDIRPLECVIFMRDVKSRILFEQMKGRGTRTILPTEFHSVNPDATHKTHCVIVDAIGVCENDKTDSRPLDRKKSVPFDKLLLSIALGNRDEDTLSSLTSRLARLDRQLEDPDKQQIQTAAQGVSLKDMVNRLLDALDPDNQIDRAKKLFNAEAPTEGQMKQAYHELAKTVCTPFDNPKLRDLLIDLKIKSEQIIDTVSQDTLIFAGFDPQAKEKAQAYVDTFRKFIEENKNELTALQILYSQPYVKRPLTYHAIKQLADAIKKPPYKLTPELLWHAYEQLESSKVRGAGPQKLLTNIVSLIRFAVGRADVLEPFSETVDRRFNYWLSVQQKLGREFNSEQMLWLNMIKEHIATSLTLSIDDFSLAPFAQKGGAVRANAVFQQQLNKILEELNKELVA